MKKQNQKLVPKLRFPEFSGEWEETILGKHATKIGSGITPRGGEATYQKSGIPFVRSQNIGWGELLLDDVAYITGEIHATFLSTEIKLNDVLLNITGASIGRCTLADDRVVGGNVNQHVCIIRINEKELTPNLVMQYLISAQGQEQIDSFQAGGNRQGLNFAQIRSFKILLPDIIEQQKIADCLAALDEKITAQSQKIEQLKAHKKGLMQKLFPAEAQTVPSLRFPEFAEAGAWKEKKMGDMFTEIKDKNKPELPLLSLTDKDGIIFQSDSNRKDNSSEDKSRYQCVKIGDIVYNTMRMWEGRSACSDKDGIISPAYTVCRLKELRDVPLFFGYYFKTYNLIRRFHIFSQGIVNDTLNLKFIIFSGIFIVYPKSNEQQKIADCLISLDELIAIHIQKLDKLKEHKIGLMQQLFPKM